MAAEHPRITTLHTVLDLNLAAGGGQIYTYVVIVDVVNLEVIRILTFVLRDALAIGRDPTRPPFVPGAVSRMKTVNIPLFKIVQVRRQSGLFSFWAVARRGSVARTVPKVRGDLIMSN